MISCSRTPNCAWNVDAVVVMRAGDRLACPAIGRALLSDWHSVAHASTDPDVGATSCMIARHTVDSGLLTTDDVAAVMAEVDEAVAEAHRFALDSPPPDPAGALDDVWTVGVPR